MLQGADMEGEALGRILRRFGRLIPSHLTYCFLRMRQAGRHSVHESLIDLREGTAGRVCGWRSKRPHSLASVWVLKMIMCFGAAVLQDQQRACLETPSGASKAECCCLDHSGCQFACALVSGNSGDIQSRSDRLRSGDRYSAPDKMPVDCGCSQACHGRMLELGRARHAGCRSASRAASGQSPLSKN